MKQVKREAYLNFLIRHRDDQLIKVVTGVRRCGKSTLFEMYRTYLLSQGVTEAQITMINFEDIRYEELLDYHALYAAVTARLLPDKMNYIFLDEIQHVKDYEKAVDSLFIKSNCDVYITGSNAYFLSGELSTRLTGRYLELSMLPLSFAEFCSGLEGERAALSDAGKFNLYLELGAFPFIVSHNYGQKEAQEYLHGIYDTVLLRDVVERKKITDITALKNLTKFLMHNIGNRFSLTKISNTMRSGGMTIDPKTVSRYLEGLTESLLFYEVNRYDIKGKQFLAQQNKYYTADIGFRNMLVQNKESDIGHVLENIVYLELLRRGDTVCVGQQTEDTEIDFVTIGESGTAYYQVCASTLDEGTLRRELAPLRAIRDNHPKLLLTLDEVFRTADYDGIHKVNLIDWLLGK